MADIDARHTRAGQGAALQLACELGADEPFGLDAYVLFRGGPVADQELAALPLGILPAFPQGIVEVAGATYWLDAALFEGGGGLLYRWAPVHGPVEPHDPHLCWEADCRSLPCVELARWELEQSLEAGEFLPCRLPREHVANRCDCCQAAPTRYNPVTIVAGAPADLENGPSAAEMPTTLCEACARLGF